MQFVIGLLVLRWEWGETKFHQVSNLTVTFLDFTNNGSEFVYGFLAAPPKICGMDPVFAFSVCWLFSLSLGTSRSVHHRYVLVDPSGRLLWFHRRAALLLRHNASGAQEDGLGHAGDAWNDCDRIVKCMRLHLSRAGASVPACALTRENNFRAKLRC